MSQNFRGRTNKAVFGEGWKPLVTTGGDGNVYKILQLGKQFGVCVRRDEVEASEIITLESDTSYEQACDADKPVFQKLVETLKTLDI